MKKKNGIAAYHEEIRKIREEFANIPVSKARKIYLKRKAESNGNPATNAGASLGAIPPELGKMMPNQVIELAKGNVDRLKKHVADLENQTKSASSEQEQWQQLADAIK